ncbi:MAG: Sua5/YciO/YrdC/YwlC family protein [Actinomycetota bacterium]|nr:Sua5/YciO/YrdC/YwlC family protein [Actinomycetota bacterium]
MGKEIDLKKGELSRHVSKACKAIADGYIIAIPLEHSYAFACDAFKHDAVRAMHVLRGDPLFTAAQVLVASTKTAQGVVREITPEISALMKEFWPGMLSMNLRPQTGLSWDLGDANQLDRVSIRVPKSRFAKALLAKSGPLAVASGVRVGRPVPKALSDIFVLDSDLAMQFNNGKLRNGPITTVLEADETGVRVLRVGSISLEEIQNIVPGASAL